MQIKLIMLLAVLLMACGRIQARDTPAAQVDAIMHKYTGEVPGASLATPVTCCRV